jgi:L-alanine-DL-glutamate epimerase-like enolase superfamily enzyme
LRVAELAALHGRPLLPHCPYFGPGFFARLQLAAALPNVKELEYHFVEVEAWLADPGVPDEVGALRVPTVPGLGFEPDMAVLQRYRREPRYA